MLKEAVVFLLGAFTIVFLLTQIIIPLFTKLDLFWIFKEKTVIVNPEPVNCVKELDELEKEATESTEAYKETLGALSNTEKKLSEIREKTKI
jgi:hypothetical protein